MGGWKLYTFDKEYGLTSHCLFLCSLLMWVGANVCICANDRTSACSFRLLGLSLSLRAPKEEEERKRDYENYLNFKTQPGDSPVNENPKNVFQSQAQLMANRFPKKKNVIQKGLRIAKSCVEHVETSSTVAAAAKFKQTKRLKPKFRFRNWASMRAHLNFIIRLALNYFVLSCGVWPRMQI